jgi:hypothetical protein
MSFYDDSSEFWTSEIPRLVNESDDVELDKVSVFVAV